MQYILKGTSIRNNNTTWSQYRIRWSTCLHTANCYKDTRWI